MAWTISYSPKAIKQLQKLDKSVSRRVDSMMSELSGLPNPRVRGKGLSGSLAGLWRFRVGDYRVICEINDGQLAILALGVAHRSKAYQGNI